MSSGRGRTTALIVTCRMASNVTFRLSPTPKLFFVREHAAVLQDRRSKLAETNTMMSSVRQDRIAMPSPPRGWVRICALRASASAGRCRPSPRICASACHSWRRSRMGASAICRATPMRWVSCAPTPTRWASAPDEIARRFRAEAADINRKTELTFPAPVPERGVPAGAVVLLGAVLAIGAYVGWYRMSGDGQPAPDMVQPVPERLTPLAGTTGMPTQPASQAAATTAPAPPQPAADARHACPTWRRPPGFRPAPPPRAAVARPSAPVPAANAAGAIGVRLPRRRTCPAHRRADRAQSGGSGRRRWRAHRAARHAGCLGSGARSHRPGAAEPRAARRRNLAGAE